MLDKKAAMSGYRKKNLDYIVIKYYNMIIILLWRFAIMNIKPSANIRQNYNEISELCKKTGEPVYLTKNGEGDLVVMDMVSFSKREKMLKLREELVAVEEERLAGVQDFNIEEIEKSLDDILDGAGRHNEKAV